MRCRGRRPYVSISVHDERASPRQSTVRGSARTRRRAAAPLDVYASPDNTALVFTGQRGGVLRRSNFRKASGWSDADAAIGLPGLHFHDLRHTGNTLAAQAGVSLAALKARMGHDGVRAAMIYQHAAAEADQKTANALDQRMGEARDHS